MECSKGHRLERMTLKEIRASTRGYDAVECDLCKARGVEGRHVAHPSQFFLPILSFNPHILPYCMKVSHEDERTSVLHCRRCEYDVCDACSKKSASNVAAALVKFFPSALELE